MPLSGVPYGPVFHSPRNGASMRRTTKAGAAAASLALLLAACSSGSDTGTLSIRAPSSSAPAAGSGTFTIWADETRTPDQGAVRQVRRGQRHQLRRRPDRLSATSATRRSRAARPAMSRTCSSAPMTGSVSSSPTASSPRSTSAPRLSSFEPRGRQGRHLRRQELRRALRVENIALLTNPELSPECPATLDDLRPPGQEAQGRRQGLAAARPADRRHRVTPTTGTRCTAPMAATSSAEPGGSTTSQTWASARRVRSRPPRGCRPWPTRAGSRPRSTSDIAKETYNGGKSAWWITGPWNVTDAVEKVPDTRSARSPTGRRPTSQPVHRRADVLHPHARRRTP